MRMDLQPRRRVARGRGRAGTGRGRGATRQVTGRAAVSQAQPASLGRQLDRRVKSGAISQEQAQRTAQQRQTFRKAFGADWRTKVYGARGAMSSARRGLAANQGNPQYGGLNSQLLKRRKMMLERAKQRLG